MGGEPGFIVLRVPVPTMTSVQRHEIPKIQGIWLVDPRSNDLGRKSRDCHSSSIQLNQQTNYLPSPNGLRIGTIILCVNGAAVDDGEQDRVLDVVPRRALG